MQILTPTRLPQLKWTDDETITISPHLASYGNRCVMAFSDGITRSFTGDQTLVNNAAAGEGSLDVAPITVSTFYFVYFVPSVADDAIMVPIFSKEEPDDGPWSVPNVTRYVAYRYVGCVWVDSGGDNAAFGHSGPEFHIQNFQDTREVFARTIPVAYTWYGTTLDDTMAPMAVTRAVKVSVGFVYGSAGSKDVFIHADGDTNVGTSTDGSWVLCKVSTIAAGSSGDRQWIPLADGDTKLWYACSSAIPHPNSIILHVEGWYDKYLIE